MLFQCDIWMICDEACNLIWINTKFVKFRCGIATEMGFACGMVRWKLGSFWGVVMWKHCQGTWWQVCYFGYVGWQLKSICWGVGWVSAFDSSALHVVCDDLWRWFKWSKKWILIDWWIEKSWKFLLTDHKFLLMVVWQTHDYLGCVFVDQSYLNFLEM